MKARDVMTERVLTATPETPLKVVATRMLSYGISGIPVVDGERALATGSSDARSRTSSRPRRIQPLHRRPRRQTALRPRIPFRAEVTPSQLWASWTRALDAAAGACDAANADWAVTKVEVETLRRRVRDERRWLAGVERDSLS
jgi:hypothetical protein